MFIKEFAKRSLPRDIAMLAVSATLAATAAVAEDDWAIEEIVVTAQKRAQSVQDIGVAVTAFAGDDVRELGLYQPKDLAAQTPGLVSSNLMGESLPSFSIRGIGLNDFNANNSGVVGMYMDEVYLSSPVFARFQMMDVDRVEVLKGPQGTLYGRNTTGGAVNFVSRKPSDNFEAYISADYELEYGQTKIEGAVGGALTDSVNARVALSSTQGGEWQKDVVSGKEYGDQDVFSIRALFDIDVSEDTSALVNIHAGYDKTLGSTWIHSGNPLTGSTFDKPVAEDVVVSPGYESKFDNDSWGAAITVTHNFETLTLTSITAYDVFNRSQIDANDGDLELIVEWDFDEKFEQLSQEFRLSSMDDETFNWIVGLNLAQEKVTIDGSRAVLDDLFGVPYASVTDIDQQNDVLGVFAHTEWQLNDEWKLITGLRYSYEDRSFDVTATEDSVIAPLFFPAGGLSAKLERDEEDVSGKLGIDYRPSDDLLIYASVSRGFKSQMIYGAASLSINAYQFVEPEELWATEMGFKATLLDGTMQLNGAVFQYDYENIQTLATEIASGVDTFRNVDEATINGAELELNWRITQYLDVRAGMSYLRSYVDKFSENALVIQDIDKGSELVFAPEWSYNALVRYNRPVGNYELTATADYSWTDDYLSLTGDESLRNHALEQVGARLALAPDSGDWEVAVWGKNLTDEIASQNAYHSLVDFEPVYLVNMPRTYGVSFKYNWM